MWLSVCIAKGETGCPRLQLSDHSSSGPEELNFPKNSMPRDGKSWKLVLLRGEICLPRRDSHNSDTFPDYLAGETRADTVMGSNHTMSGTAFLYTTLPCYLNNSCLPFKCKPWGRQDGSIGKGSSSLSWELEFDPGTHMVGENWLLQLDFWLPTSLVTCASFTNN